MTDSSAPPPGAGNPGQPDSGAVPTPTVLAIGRSDIGLPGTIIATPYSRLSAALLSKVKPDTVTLPLFSPDCDAAQVIEKLVELGFSGRVIVAAPDLPDPRMVLRELSALAPGLRIDLAQR